MNESNHPPVSPEENLEVTLGRRELLKALAVTGGAVTAASLLPGQWIKPVIEAGVLPAHAQTSIVTATGTATATTTATATGTATATATDVPLIFSLECSGNPTSGQTGIVDSLQATVTANQPVSLANIQVQVAFELTNPSDPSTVHDTQTTNSSGIVTFADVFCPFQNTQDYNLVFSFVDQATYGTSICTLGLYTFSGC